MLPIESFCRQLFKSLMPNKSFDSLKLQLDLYAVSKIDVIQTMILLLTNYQTTNFRPFQTERVCRRQFQI